MRIAGIKQCLGLALLSFALWAAWPGAGYNPRLELFNPSFDPTLGEVDGASLPRPESANVINEFRSCPCPVSRKPPEPLRRQLVHNAIAVYQKLTTNESSSITRDLDRASHYCSLTIAQPDGRGPPSFA